MADIPPPLSAKEFFTPEFLRDPYPTYRRYLDGSGLQFLIFHGGVWAVFKHADCSTFLRDPRLSAKRTGALIDEFRNDPLQERADYYVNYVQCSTVFAKLGGRMRSQFRSSWEDEK